MMLSIVVAVATITCRLAPKIDLLSSQMVIEAANPSKELELPIAMPIALHRIPKLPFELALKRLVSSLLARPFLSKNGMQKSIELLRIALLDRQVNNELGIGKLARNSWPIWQLNG